MVTARSSQVIAWLKATGEASRLRLLALCRERELSVSDLAAALGQSEPRVSRHLRILCEAGLLQRSRQGQWVHYGLASSDAAAGFAQGLLAQLDRQDPQLVRDRERIQLRRAQPGELHAVGSKLGRALQSFVENGRPDLIDSALVVGVEHPELLLAAASHARHCTAIAHSPRAAQSARAFSAQHGFDCRVVLSTDRHAVAIRDAERVGQSFDVVVLDHLAAPAAELERLLDWAGKHLAPAGRIWLFERYEALEGSREKVVEHPIARLRRLLSHQGLSCHRLTPIEADGEHVLAVVAVPAATGSSADTPSTLRSV